MLARQGGADQESGVVRSLLLLGWDRFGGALLNLDSGAASCPVRESGKAPLTGCQCRAILHPACPVSIFSRFTHHFRLGAGLRVARARVAGPPPWHTVSYGGTMSYPIAPPSCDTITTRINEIQCTITLLFLSLWKSRTLPSLLDLMIFPTRATQFIPPLANLNLAHVM